MNTLSTSGIDQYSEDSQQRNTATPQVQDAPKKLPVLRRENREGSVKKKKKRRAKVKPSYVSEENDEARPAVPSSTNNTDMGIKFNSRKKPAIHGEAPHHVASLSSAGPGPGPEAQAHGAPQPKMMTTPVPDAQVSSVLQREIRQRSAKKKRAIDKPSLLSEDHDDAPTPFQEDAVSAAKENNGIGIEFKPRNSQEIDEEIDETTPYHATSPEDVPESGAQTLETSRDPPGTYIDDQDQDQDQVSPQLRLHSPQMRVQQIGRTNITETPFPAACYAVSWPHDAHQPESVSSSSQDQMLEINHGTPSSTAGDQASVQLQVRPQTSMLHNTETPFTTTFHAPEAMLVVEGERTPPVVRATIIPGSSAEDADDAPWWKRYHQRNVTLSVRNIIISVLLVTAVVIMGTLLASKDSNDGVPTNNGSESGNLRRGDVPKVNPTKHIDPDSLAEELVSPPDNKPTSSIPISLTSVKPTSPFAVKPTPSTKASLMRSSQAIPFINDGDASEFGSAVVVSGDTVVIGAYKDSGNVKYSGSAYVFHHHGDTWTQQAKLLPNDGEAYDEFGYAIAVSGDTAVIGVHKDDDNGSDSGSAYVYTRNGDNWSQQAKLVPNDGETNDHFGHAVGIFGDTIVVGAPYDDDNGSDSGSVYVFIRNGDAWNQQAKLLPKDGQDNDYFGKSLAMSGDTVVIGAEKDNDNGIDSGSAYVFIREGGGAWHQHSKLLPNDGKEYDNFGYAVAMSGGTIVVGADGADDMGSLSGSAYVFIDNGDTWSQQAKLLPSDGQAGDNFGHAVAVSGDTVIIGAKDDHGNHSDSGAAYVYIRDGEMWKQHAKLLPKRDSEDYDFGLAVAVDGDNVVIGTHRDSETGNVSGSAYVFPLERNA